MGIESGTEATPKVSIGQATTEIMGIMDANFQTGRYDEERNVFMGYIARVESGDLSPEEGVAAARAYANSRQEGYGD